MHVSDRIAERLGVPPPATVEQIIQFMLTRPLDFPPGTRQVYSNYGYALLGEVIEAVTGQSYASYVQDAVLRPAGIERMQLGRNWPADRPSDEVAYYRLRPPKRVQPVGPDTVGGDGRVPFPDGGIDVEVWKAHGGWIATPTDLVRFATAVDGDPRRPDVLERETWETMMRPPPGRPKDTAMHAPDDAHYAMGWYVRPADEATGSHPAAWWHMGDQPGTMALLFCTGRTQIAFLANRSTWSRTAHADVRDALRTAARSVDRWPAHDRFDRLP
jgi:CubicO group peptidase (beta-lactamase class C family)